MGTTTSGYGYLFPNDEVGAFNPTAFVVAQALSRMRTLTLCVVRSLGATGFVNVQPIVNMVDGDGNALEHGTIYNVPYLQMRAGTSAIVAVPVVGDIGLMAVCDRDISSAKTSLAPGPPPSGREYDLSDAIYIMGISLGIPPTTTVTVNAAGIALADATGNIIAMTTGGISITPASGQPVMVNGAIHATGPIIAGFGGPDQVTVQLHQHTANDTPPTPGT